MGAAAATGQVFRLPDLGEGLTEAEVVEWRVAVGDVVTVDQIVVEVETAKAAVEVPVPFAGTVVALHAEAGAPLAVGAPLISVGGADGADAPQPLTAGGDAAGGGGAGGAGDDGAAERYREEEQAGSGNVLIGYGTGHEGERPSRRRRAARRAEESGPAGAGADAEAEAVRVISPLVRKLAREHGVDLAALARSAPGGVVRRRDVDEAIALAEDGSSEVSAAGAEDERIPLRGLRRAVAEKLSRSRSEIPDATTWVDVDATALLAARDALRAAAPDRPVGLMALLARICVAGLRRYPELNSSVDTERGEIVRHREIHLGFAAQTERGLVVPVVRGAGGLTTRQLHERIGELTAQARGGGLPPQALVGGTFTLNNYGVFGVDGSTPIINHPEAALLGVGRIIDRPWAVDGQLALRKVTQLSFTFDHRVCDGGVAGGFLRYVADCVENPVVLLAEL